MSLDKEVKERNFDRTMRLVLLLIVSIMCDMTKKSIMHIHVKHFYFLNFFFVCNNSYTISAFQNWNKNFKKIYSWSSACEYITWWAQRMKKIITSKWAKVLWMSRILCIAYLTFIGGKIYDLVLRGAFNKGSYM
jgi:hypothetical protein